MKLLVAYLLGRERAGNGPVDAIIEITSRCNLDCLQCRRRELVTHPADMPLSLFRTAVDSLSPYLELAYLFGWGEPLLWPHLTDALMLTRRKRIRRNITTNIMLLHGDRAEQLAQSEADIVVLALDSHDPQVYEKYRLGARFSIAIQNIHDFLNRCKELKSRSHIILQMIRYPETSGKEKDYVAFASQFGKVSPTFRRYFDPSEAVRTAGSRAYRACPLLWRGPLYIRSDGMVFPCCIKLDCSLGNIDRTSVSEMWNGRKMRDLRRQHTNGQINTIPQCATCYHSNPHAYPGVYAVLSYLLDSYHTHILMLWVEKFRHA